MLDPALIDLFRSEVETHSETLNAALLELERSPGDSSRIDEMMRAAHSIKGASRVVGIDPAVRVAHVMEDCFVAAQKGTLKLTSADVDVLLRGVDLLGTIGGAACNAATNIEGAYEAEVQAMVAQLEGMLNRKGNDAAVPLKKTSQPVPVTPKRVTLDGPVVLDANAAESLRSQLVTAVRSRCEAIELNLLPTNDLDVQGLALLAAIPGYLAEHQVPLHLSGVSESLRIVLRTTGLEASYHSSASVRRGAE